MPCKGRTASPSKPCRAILARQVGKTSKAKLSSHETGLDRFLAGGTRALKVGLSKKGAPSQLESIKGAASQAREGKVKVKCVTIDLADEEEKEQPVEDPRPSCQVHDAAEDGFEQSPTSIFEFQGDPSEHEKIQADVNAPKRGRVSVPMTQSGSVVEKRLTEFAYHRKAASTKMSRQVVVMETPSDDEKRPQPTKVSPSVLDRLKSGLKRRWEQINHD